MTTPDPDRLRCGRTTDDILDQVADGRGDQRDGHQQSCPHCQAVLGEYDRLWAPLRTLAEEQVTAPDGLLDTALARVRGAVAQTDYGIIDGPQGVTRIAARVVVVTARESAQEVSGVRVALSKYLHPTLAARPTHPHGRHTLPDAGPEVTAGVAGRSTAIEITVAADYGHDLLELSERVRAEVTDRVRALTDLEPVQVTVIIDDVLD